MNIVFGIASFNRPDKQYFLAYLKGLGYKRDDIYIGTQCRRDYEQYQDLFGKDASYEGLDTPTKRHPDADGQAHRHRLRQGEGTPVSFRREGGHDRQPQDIRRDRGLRLWACREEPLSGVGRVPDEQRLLHEAERVG